MLLQLYITVIEHHPGALSAYNLSIVHSQSLFFLSLSEPFFLRLVFLRFVLSPSPGLTHPLASSSSSTVCSFLPLRRRCSVPSIAGAVVSG